MHEVFYDTHSANSFNCIPQSHKPQRRLNSSTLIAHGGSHGQPRPSPPVTKQESEQRQPTEASESVNAETTADQSEILANPPEFLEKSVKPSFGFGEVVFLLLILVPMALLAIKIQIQKQLS